MSVNNEQRLIRYEKLREAGFDSHEATKHKDRKKQTVELLIEVKTRYTKIIESIVKEIIDGTYTHTTEYKHIIENMESKKNETKK
jgi:hypothetical protein